MMRFISSALVAGTLSLFAAGPGLAVTSAQVVYERPETRTMPSPLPRMPQAPPVSPETPQVTPAGVPVVERDSLPPPPSGEPMSPPQPVPPIVPQAEDVPFVGERLPVTGMDAALLLGAAALAATIGMALRRASLTGRMAPAGLFEIPFAVPAPETAPALEGAIASAPAVRPEAVGPRPSGRAAAPLLVLGAVAAAGGLGLAALRRRPGRRPSTLRQAFAAAARPAARPEPASALLVAMAVPAIARRIGGGASQRRRPRTRPRPMAVRETA